MTGLSGHMPTLPLLEPLVGSLGPQEDSRSTLSMWRARRYRGQVEWPVHPTGELLQT